MIQTNIRGKDRRNKTHINPTLTTFYTNLAKSKNSK